MYGGAGGDAAVAGLADSLWAAGLAALFAPHAADAGRRLCAAPHALPERQPAAAGNRDAVWLCAERPAGGLDGVCGAAGVPDWTAFKEVRKQSRRLQKGDAWTVLQLNIEIAVDHERGIFGLTPG